MFRRSTGALAVSAVALACQLGPFTAGATAAAGTFIRVNQVGYQPGAPKRAYVLSKSVEMGAVLDPGARRHSSDERHSGATAWLVEHPCRQCLRTRLRLAADAGHLHDHARRRTASGELAAVCDRTGRLALTAPLERALSFYQNERDGPEYIPSALRTAPAHLNDEHAMTYLTPKVNGEGAFKGELTSLGETINASGGWWDAGDYLKFVQTTSYAVALQLVGVRDFPSEMGAAASGSDFTEEARFGVEWLLRMWNEHTGTLYYQVGIGTGNASTFGDHDIWRLPQEDDTYGDDNPLYRFIRHQPVFRAGPPGSPVSPNLAGRDAAAFALCFQVFDTSRPALASRCLRAGEHIFALANTNPQGNLLTTIPFDFYPETEWRDDLELGATELAIALSDKSRLPGRLAHTEPLFYLRQAASWASAYIAQSGAQGEGLNLYDVSGLAHVELVRAIRQEDDPSGLAVTEADLLGDLAHKLEVASAQAQRDPFGFGFPWDEADTVSHGDGLSVMASAYDELTGTQTYRTYSERWLGNVLGANAWGSSFIIGDGSVYPDCPQHQVANIVGSLDGSPPVLAGAVVEGPSNEKSKGKLPGMRPCPARGGNSFAHFDNKAVYKDNVQSYTNTEPAIDLTASSMLAFSWQIAQAAPLPTPVGLAGPLSMQPSIGGAPFG
jgi:endoglucanase